MTNLQKTTRALEAIIFESWDDIFDVDNVAELRIGRVHLIVKYVLEMHAAALKARIDIRRKQANIMAAISVILTEGRLYDAELARLLGFEGANPRLYHGLNWCLFKMLKNTDFDNQPLFVDGFKEIRAHGQGFTALLNKGIENATN